MIDRLVALAGRDATGDERTSRSSSRLTNKRDAPGSP
jgi:hypothetical protein